jgi:hypothetical protein
MRRLNHSVTQTLIARSADRAYFVPQTRYFEGQETIGPATTFTHFNIPTFSHLKSLSVHATAGPIARLGGLGDAKKAGPETAELMALIQRSIAELNFKWKRRGHS